MLRIFKDTVKPEVGIGATLIMYSDKHAVTIIKVTPTTVTFQRDKATRIDNYGMSDYQDYEYSRDEKGVTEIARLRKDGTYRTVNNERVFIGVREEYFDYSF